MKRFLFILVIILCLSSCADDKTFYFKNDIEISETEFNNIVKNNVNKDTLSTFLAECYGLANEDLYKCEDIQYEMCFGNIFWSVVLIETVAAPIYFIGWSLYEPVKIKKGIKKPKC